MTNKTAQHKKAILEALEHSLGVVTTACKKVGIGRTTFYQWMRDDKEFAQQVKDIENVALDFAESQLFKQIKDNNPTSTIFYLKTKGKKRGYIEKKEIDNSGRLEVKNVVLDQSDIDQLTSLDDVWDSSR